MLRRWAERAGEKVNDLKPGARRGGSVEIGTLITEESVTRPCIADHLSTQTGHLMLMKSMPNPLLFLIGDQRIVFTQQTKKMGLPMGESLKGGGPTAGCRL